MNKHKDRESARSRVTEVIRSGSDRLSRVLASGGIGLAAVGLTEIGTRLDAAFNPQIIAALQKQMEWYQVFTTGHAPTVIYLNHEPVSAAVVFAVGTVAGLVSLLKD